MKLYDLYGEISEREFIMHSHLIRPGRRIAIRTPSWELDIMKVGMVGYGRTNVSEEMKYMAVAMIYPDVLSVRLNCEGEINLNELVETNKSDSDVYEGGPIKNYGILGHYKKAHWVNLETSVIFPITRIEMKTIQESYLDLFL